VSKENVPAAQKTRSVLVINTLPSWHHDQWASFFHSDPSCCQAHVLSLSVHRWMTWNGWVCQQQTWLACTNFHPSSSVEAVQHHSLEHCFRASRLCYIFTSHKQSHTINAYSKILKSLRRTTLMHNERSIHFISSILYKILFMQSTRCRSPGSFASDWPKLITAYDIRRHGEAWPKL